MSQPSVEPIPSDIQSRLDFIGLDAAALQRLGGVQELIDRHLPPALTLFYEKIATIPQVESFFSGREQMARAQDSQTAHWKKIAAGRFDATYMEAAKRIGLRHAKIGLEPRWYIGGYGIIVETLLRGVISDFVAARLADQPRRLFGGRDRVAALEEAAVLGRAVAEVMKAILIDIDVAVTVYFEKLTEEAAEAERRNSEKIELAVAATGKVLKDLAAGDLTGRITETFDPSLQGLKDDTNAVADRLAAIIGQLRTTSGGLKLATGEILAGANDLSQRTTMQAAAIEETSAAMEQLATTVTENAARADLAGVKAREVSATATNSGRVMQQANEAMERIAASSGKISKIIGLIDDIAFQTNLLALNASVEAARAGDAGKGFAVVAIEVRRLAQSAAQASAEIKALIEQSGSEVDAGSKLVAASAGQLNAMMESVRENERLITEIAQASGEQSSSIGEVTTAIRQMDEMTQHNAALVEETNAAIEQTEGQASELDKIVEVFVLDPAGTAPTEGWAAVAANLRSARPVGAGGSHASHAIAGARPMRRAG